jgi:hypothetical protein
MNIQMIIYRRRLKTYLVQLLKKPEDADHLTRTNKNKQRHNRKRAEVKAPCTVSTLHSYRSLMQAQSVVFFFENNRGSWAVSRN